VHDAPPAPRARGVWWLVAAAALAAAASPSFVRARAASALALVPGPGVTATRPLSSWLPELAGTPADTPVYVMDGPGAGGRILVLGGTHGDEPAGMLAAAVLVERAHVGAGRL